MKYINLKALNRALDILQKVKDTIDPNAFIAGGLPALIYLGQDWRSDIDIFFTSPNFNSGPLGESAFNQVKLLFPELQSVNRETYWYNKRFTRIGKLNGVDFIQVIDVPKDQSVIDYVFEKFDINLCKIALLGHKSEYHEEIALEPSEEFLAGIKTKTLIYDTNLSDHKYESEAQAKVTLERLEKYKKRFPDFTVKELK